MNSTRVFKCKCEKSNLWFFSTLCLVLLRDAVLVKEPLFDVTRGTNISPAQLGVDSAP